MIGNEGHVSRSPIGTRAAVNKMSTGARNRALSGKTGRLSQNGADTLDITPVFTLSIGFAE